jgi:hypothetical protein
LYHVFIHNMLLELLEHHYSIISNIFDAFIAATHRPFCGLIAACKELRTAVLAHPRMIHAAKFRPVLVDIDSINILYNIDCPKHSISTSILEFSGQLHKYEYVRNIKTCYPGRYNALCVSSNNGYANYIYEYFSKYIINTDNMPDRMFSKFDSIYQSIPGWLYKYSVDVRASTNVPTLSHLTIRRTYLTKDQDWIQIHHSKNSSTNCLIS